MKKIDLGQTLSVLANIGVIAGIIILAVELQQNNRLLAAEAMGSVFENRLSRQDRVLDNPIYTALIAKNDRNEPLTVEEQIMMEASYSRGFIAWQREYFLFQQGVVPEDYFRASFDSMKGAFADRDVSYDGYDHWQQWKGGAHPTYQAFIDQCIFADCAEIPR